jgi:hypothetical protein
MALLLGALANISLVCLGWFVFSTTSKTPGSWLGLAADVAILVAYGTIGWLGPPMTNRLDTRILGAAVLTGGTAGILFGLEMVAEYVLLPSDNALFGLMEFGTVFFLFFLSAVWVAFRTRRIGFGILTALWSSGIASLIWLGSLLVITYAFHGSGRQTQVFRAEGNFEDFTRSGQTDFEAFIMQDLMGAGFYHLLLSPIIASLVGAFGAAAGKGIAQIVRPRETPSRGW